MRRNELEKMAVAMHCNLKPPLVAPVGLYIGIVMGFSSMPMHTAIPQGMFRQSAGLSKGVLKTSF